MEKITQKIFNDWSFQYTGHGNMGYQMDEHGNYTDRHKGYSYKWTCVENSRVYFWERHWKLDDGGIDREWYVDGEKVAVASPWTKTPFDILLPLLNSPPNYTLVELYCLLRMEDMPRVAWEVVPDWIAGCERPEPYYIDRATRWGAVRHAVEILREKGAIDIEMGVCIRKVSLI